MDHNMENSRDRSLPHSLMLINDKVETVMKTGLKKTPEKILTPLL